MAHPKHKTSKAVTRKRRTHKKLTSPSLVTCSNCGEPVLPHHACAQCGHYRGRQVADSAEA